MKKKPNQFRPQDIIANSGIAVIKRETYCATLEDLTKALHDAFRQGEEAAILRSKKPLKNYSTQKLYSDRYAALRDLAAHEINRSPITFRSEPSSVPTMQAVLLQGDLLDRFIDKHLAGSGRTDLDEG